MLDHPKDEGEKENWDWTIARKARQFGPLILAGGLNPENIEEALEAASPYSVDVCRGVEKEVGVKNPEKVQEFIRKVRKWNYRKI